MNRFCARVALALVVVLLLGLGQALAAPDFRFQSSHIIPVASGYVNQTFSIEDCQGKLEFPSLKLDPAYEGFLTLWTRGNAKRIIVHMNKSSIEVQADVGDTVKTVLQERTGLTYTKGLTAQVAGNNAVLTLGGQTFTVPGVTAFVGKVEIIGISGSYDFYAYVEKP